ncbi:MAG: CDGSH iron-sulfur domain-containing protein [Bacteroidales bacterium]|jgi:CDGSH-type Zn-finger protein|nr:CDGSH iron-sulfur domain-containing protein [Bacteroidales bacterium]
MSKTKITLIENGPLMVEGPIELKNARGKEIKTEEKTFLCRCGGSKNKPFCDGTHKEIDFKS